MVLYCQIVLLKLLNPQIPIIHLNILLVFFIYIYLFLCLINYIILFLYLINYIIWALSHRLRRATLKFLAVCFTLPSLLPSRKDLKMAIGLWLTMDQMDVCGLSLLLMIEVEKLLILMLNLKFLLGCLF